MRFLPLFLMFFAFGQPLRAQGKLDRALKKFNNESVAYISVHEMTDINNTVFLDTRKKEEYDVSHLKDAIWVGYEKFQKDSVSLHVPDRDTPIIVYCSIGVRSEDIGEKLQQAGYTNVKNLYGGIFEWKNHGNPVYNPKKTETDSVHAFDKDWGKLLTKGIKVYGSPTPATSKID